jgi:hypothetical protein
VAVVAVLLIRRFQIVPVVAVVLEVTVQVL